MSLNYKRKQIINFEASFFTIKMNTLDPEFR